MQTRNGTRLQYGRRVRIDAWRPWRWRAQVLMARGPSHRDSPDGALRWIRDRYCGPAKADRRRKDAGLRAGNLCWRLRGEAERRFPPQGTGGEQLATYRTGHLRLAL